MPLSQRPLSLLIICFACLLLAVACEPEQAAPKNKLESVLSKGELSIATSIGPTTFYLIDDHYAGFEFELATLFAESLGVTARFIIEDNFDDLFSLVKNQQADFVAAGLTVTPQRQQSLLFTSPYQQVTQQLIYHHRQRRPRMLSQLSSPFFEVVADTSHAENLALLSNQQPQLKWSSVTGTTVHKLLEELDRGLLDYTVADSNQFMLLRGKHPKLAVAFDLTKPEDIAWAFAKTADLSLYKQALSFLEQLKQNGMLSQLQDKHFGYSKTLDYVGLCTYKRHIKERLPQLQPYFQDAGLKHKLNWRLLAALAYQESHWNKDAVSPTGVRGVMMLTQATAKQLAVIDRLDPQQSILGGGEYLASRLKRLPQRITEPDRTWMALAAYNIGYGHLEDARVITQKRGHNPDKWLDVEKSLPLLAEKLWYEKTKYGYARGNEPVSYVKNIRQYYNILRQLIPDSVIPPNRATERLLNSDLPAL